MNLNSAIETLIKQNCFPITLGVSEKGKPIVHAEQRVQTHSGASKIIHQCSADSHEDAIEELQKAVAVCEQLNAKIVKVKTN